MTHLLVILLSLVLGARSDSLEAAQRQIDARDWAGAEASLRAIVADEPRAFRARYGLACVLAQQGDLDGASDALVEAISYGYSDFRDMRREALLAPLHGTETWQTVMDGWTELLDERGRIDLETTKQAMGKAYRTDRDESVRLNFVYAQRPESYELTRADLDAIGHWAREELLGDALDAGGDLPDPWVTVLLPSPEDFVILVGAPNVGGYYDHDAKRLISMDVGPSLAHEYLHVLHWRVMTRAGQRHPDWLMEALGALVEDTDLHADGTLVPAPSWRTNIAKRRLDMGRLMNWSELFTLPTERFRSTGAGAPYAQARAIALYLWQRGVLRLWFSAYLATFDDDPSGALAMEIATGEPIDAIEADYRRWLADLPWAPEEPRSGMAWMGADFALGQGDGPRIDWLHAGAPARKAGLRIGDVPVRIDDRRVWTRADVYRLLGAHEPGDTVSVEVRRGARFVSAQVELTEYDR